MDRGLNNNGINNTSNGNTNSSLNNSTVNSQNVEPGIEINQIPNFNNQTVNDNVSTNTEVLNFYNEPVNNQPSPNTINNGLNQSQPVNIEPNNATPQSFAFNQNTQNMANQNVNTSSNVNNLVPQSPVISPVGNPVSPTPVVSPDMNNISNANNPSNIAETEKQDNNKEYEESGPQFEEVNIKKPIVRTDSYFDGGLLELIGWKFLAGLITIITLGIGRPWAKCMIYSWQFKHTVYNGKRLKFEGTGGDLFVQYFKWILLSIVTLGIYLFFIPVCNANFAKSLS